MLATFHGIIVEIEAFDTRHKECLVNDLINHTFSVWVSTESVKLVKEGE